jgi:predicted ATPase
LLTLVGPGGIGKTRLALQAAQNLVEAPIASMAFPDGIYFVPLASISEPDFLVSAIAEALHFSFYSNVEPKQQLLDYLREKSMLLVLDNFEQLLTPPAASPGESLSEVGKIEGTTLLTEILATAPAVKILVTSREALNLQEEWFHPVAGMAYPPAEGLEVAETAEALETYSAVQLFSQCARRVRPGFSLATEKKGVVWICRLVEGMPLGIELAAAWLKILSCDQIARQIEHDLDFLATSFRNVPVRHRSMRAVFEHSWDMLSEAEQAVLRRLSVFQGGFQPAAAAQVAGASLPGLAALVEKSLVQLSSTGRYQLHELLRQFAEEKLRTVLREQEQAQERHSQYYLAFLQRQESKLKGAQQQEALAEIGQEIENIRTGWNWAVEQSQIERLDQALSSLYEFYWIRSWFQEGQETFRRAADSLAGAKSESREEREPGLEKRSRIVLGKLLARQGAFCYVLRLYDLAKECLQESLAMARHLEVPQEIAFSLNFLGNVVAWQGDNIGAQPLLQESLALCREIGYLMGAISSLQGLGMVTQYLGRYREAKQWHQESLIISREIGYKDGIAHALDELGTTAWFSGEYQESKQYYQESLSIFKEVGDRYGIAMALGGLALVALGLGERNW